MAEKRRSEHERDNYWAAIDSFSFRSFNDLLHLRSVSRFRVSFPSQTQATATDCQNGRAVCNVVPLWPVRPRMRAAAATLVCANWAGLVFRLRAHYRFAWLTS